MIFRLAVAAMVLGVMVCGPHERAGAESHGVAFTADACDVSALPAEIQTALKKDYDEWRVVREADLNSMARGRWQGAKVGACPGLAAGAITAIGAKDYAVLLVPAHAGDRGYKLVVFKRATETSPYEAVKVAESARVKPQDYFIRVVPLEDWVDGIRIKKSQVSAPDALELVDSDEEKYGAELYFYTGGKFKSEPIDD
jgi:hypothetical protein